MWPFGIEPTISVETYDRMRTELQRERDAMKQALRDALALVDASGFMSAERQIELRRLREIAK